MRARDAAGNWGPVRAVVLPIDRLPPAVRASGARSGDLVEAVLHVREHGLGPRRSCATASRSAGKPGAGGRSRRPSRVHLTLHVTRGRRAILRVRAEDVAGNATRSGFTIPR